MRITTGEAVSSTRATRECVSLELSDGSKRVLDHVMLATGYLVDISLYEFLGTELLKQLRVSDGYPELNAGFESSLPGLHFVGAPAACSFGPLWRFVSGTPFTAAPLPVGLCEGTARTGTVFRNKRAAAYGGLRFVGSTRTPSRIAATEPILVRWNCSIISLRKLPNR